MILLIVALAALVPGCAVAVGISVVRIPDAHAAATAQSNTWLYRDGTLLARTGDTNRQNVPLDEISVPARHATLAAEDRSFYEEGALNTKGILRSVVNAARGKGAQGGSTITQQYVKNTYLTQDQSISRKVKEMFIAIRVDAVETKDEVLAGYLNTCYYGRGAYGIKAAAQAYFGVDPGRLDAAQGAYLATLLNAPATFDVSTATPQGHRNAVARWNYVLDGMVKEGWLAADQRAGLGFPTVLEPRKPSGLSGQTGYLVGEATEYLTSHEILTDAQLAHGGYTITLSVDPVRQQQLQDAVRTQLTDQLTPSTRPADAAVQAGAASVDPGTGAVLALYGGQDATEHWVDNATRRDYQAGSTFKAITLAAALNSGAKTQGGTPITPDTVYDGTSRRPVQGGKGVPYAPPNEGDRNWGRITLQQATDWSVNSVFAQVAQDTGLARVRDTAVALGLPSGTPGLAANPAITLGVATPSALDMAGVYATLDNDGLQTDPWIVQALQHEGEPVALPEHHQAQAVTTETARATTDMLRGVIADPGGTGNRAQIDRPAAGKTGTTDNSRSVWFVGYTPELVTAVALFGQDPATGKQVALDGVGGTGQAAGGRFPAQIWAAYAKAALAGTPVTDFAQPADRPAPKAPATTPSTPRPSPTRKPTPSPTPATPAAPTAVPSPSTAFDPPSDPAEQSPTRGSTTGRGATTPRSSDTPTDDSTTTDTTGNPVVPGRRTS
ncbi:transglycosylase domain-containing protein [Kitasatospora sp. NPDC048540]|uniref:transglycosylase domain-containing protein n=1 Tax=unclassified Kitasatospora TaxID=2633591 RepID=UPI0006914063|nr:transglycosylase domain-containing protein [Kitasatospora sp. MBT63]